MDANHNLQDLAIYLFNKSGSIKKGEDISLKIYEALAYNKQIPNEAYALIPDKRYHKQFDIVYGFMWYLRKLKEPPFESYYSILSSIAMQLKIPFINQHDYQKLLLHTLIVDYFNDRSLDNNLKANL